MAEKLIRLRATRAGNRSIVTKRVAEIGTGGTWQSFRGICLPCSRNLSSGHVAKCDPKFLSWTKFWKSQNTSKTPSRYLGGAGRLWKTRANDRNLGANCQRNVINLKHDQFKSQNFLTFSLSLWTNEATTTLCHFNVFTKTLFRRAIHKLIILLAISNVFTGTPRQVPSQACYSPS